MSRTTPMIEFRLDGHVLGALFKLDVESVHLRQTLTGRPYIVLMAKAPAGYADGEKVYGTAKENPNGSLHLGFSRT